MRKGKNSCNKLMLSVFCLIALGFTPCGYTQPPEGDQAKTTTIVNEKDRDIADGKVVTINNDSVDSLQNELTQEGVNELVISGDISDKNGKKIIELLLERPDIIVRYKFTAATSERIANAFQMLTDKNNGIRWLYEEIGKNKQDYIAFSRDIVNGKLKVAEITVDQLDRIGNIMKWSRVLTSFVNESEPEPLVPTNTASSSSSSSSSSLPSTVTQQSTTKAVVDQEIGRIERLKRLVGGKISARTTSSTTPEITGATVNQAAADVTTTATTTTTSSTSSIIEGSDTVISPGVAGRMVRLSTEYVLGPIGNGLVSVGSAIGTGVSWIARVPARVGHRVAEMVNVARVNEGGASTSVSPTVNRSWLNVLSFGFFGRARTQNTLTEPVTTVQQQIATSGASGSLSSEGSTPSSASSISAVQADSIATAATEPVITEQQQIAISGASGSLNSEVSTPSSASSTPAVQADNSSSEETSKTATAATEPVITEQQQTATSGASSSSSSEVSNTPSSSTEAATTGTPASSSSVSPTVNRSWLNVLSFGFLGRARTQNTLTEPVTTVQQQIATSGASGSLNSEGSAPSSASSTPAVQADNSSSEETSKTATAATEPVITEQQQIATSGASGSSSSGVSNTSSSSTTTIPNVSGTVATTITPMGANNDSSIVVQQTEVPFNNLNDLTVHHVGNDFLGLEDPNS